jgi:hypothetical protein
MFQIRNSTLEVIVIGYEIEKKIVVQEKEKETSDVNTSRN